MALSAQRHAVERDKYGKWMELSARKLDTDGPSQSWVQEAFWVPEFVPGGFPLLLAITMKEAQEWQAYFDAHGVDCRITRDIDDARANLMRSIQVLVGDGYRGMCYQGPVGLDQYLADWLVAPCILGDSHTDAYAKFITMPLAATEDVVGRLGPYVWDDFDKLVSAAGPDGSVDPKTWSVF